jgi:hypothetical protein
VGRQICAASAGALVRKGWKAGSTGWRGHQSQKENPPGWASGVEICPNGVSAGPSPEPVFCAANLHRLSTFPQQRISDEGRTFAAAEPRVQQVFAGCASGAIGACASLRSPVERQILRADVGECAERETNSRP